ncbi:MAG: acetylxylan esterase, partial [Armatimonadetes bacterium]|nr:acetylxylan esterase [Armatimonadota bacterium]
MRFRLLFAILLCHLPSQAENVFAPWLTDNPPKVVETVAREVVEGVEVTRLKWLNRVDAKTGREVIIYGIVARPASPGPHPGVLVCHGGGGYADQVKPQVIGWAKKGYVAVCQDQPGICNAQLGSSSGPCFERGPFTVVDHPADAALFDGVVAALNGLALLRSQPDVDRQRIGVTGGSWGGYMTTMVTGLAGERVKAAFSVFGCGFYDVGSTWQSDLNRLTPERRAIWLEHLDAGRRAANVRAAYMVASPLNDWFFWPSAVTRTYETITAPKNICFMPNDSHVLTQPGGTAGPPEFERRANRTWMEQVWLNHHLKGEGEAFPTASAAAVVGREGHAVRVRFRAG